MSRQPPLDVQNAAHSAQAKWRIPASVSIGQWALESAWGAQIPIGSFNPFGIKARVGEPSILTATHEFIHGQLRLVQAAFRKFGSLEEAFERHAELLATAPVYAAAMRALPSVDGFIATMAPHYATDPHYAASLLAVIAGSNLRRFDTPPPSSTAFGRDASRAAVSAPGDHP